MPKRKNLVLPLAATRKIEQAITDALYVYLNEFTSKLFSDYRTVQSQDIIARSLAECIRRYEQTTGQKISAAVAYDLLD